MHYNVCRDEAVKQAEASAARATQAEATASRLQTHQGKHADMSAQLSTLLQQNKELAAQLQAITQQASQASPDACNLKNLKKLVS